MRILRDLYSILTCLALLTSLAAAEARACRTSRTVFSPLAKDVGYRLRCSPNPPMRLRGGCADPSFSGLEEKQACLETRETPTVHNSLTKKKELLRLLCGSSNRRVLMYAVRKYALGCFCFLISTCFLEQNSTEASHEKMKNFHEEMKKLHALQCGPTVYAASHLGHARTYVQLDVIRRIMSMLPSLSHKFQKASFSL
jgi:hypothetical protein